MPVLQEIVFNALQRRSHSLLTGFSDNSEASATSGLATEVRETEKLKYVLKNRYIRK